jgi:hypothetical protein
MVLLQVTTIVGITATSVIQIIQYSVLHRQLVLHMTPIIIGITMLQYLEQLTMLTLQGGITITLYNALPIVKTAIVMVLLGVISVMLVIM